MKERLDATAEAFRALGESLRTTFAPAGPNDNDAAVVFDRAADRVCRKRPLQSSCWQRDHVTTFNALNDALPAMMDRGRGEAADFPAHFSKPLPPAFSAFLNAANEELTASSTGGSTRPASRRTARRSAGSTAPWPRCWGPLPPSSAPSSP